MDNRTRGAIEKAIDDMIFRMNFSSDVQWLEQEYPIKSLKDVALGLAIGAIETVAIDEIVSLEKGLPTVNDLQELKLILRQRLPEIVDKIRKELSV